MLSLEVAPEGVQRGGAVHLKPVLVRSRLHCIVVLDGLCHMIMKLIREMVGCAELLARVFVASRSKTLHCQLKDFDFFLTRFLS